jgi:N-acetylmuramoyl-L-alanine amidase
MRKIYISAGHSNKQGRDRGAAGNGFIEGELTVELRNLVSSELKKMGVSPIVDADNSILSETINFFKNLTTNNCIVLDLHWNAGPKTATGTETLIPAVNTDFERRLAHALSKAVSDRLKIPMRGRHSGFSGVKTEADSHHGRLGWMRLTGENVLMEMCFISNPNDMKSYQENKAALAYDIAKVLFDFASNGATTATTTTANKVATPTSNKSKKIHVVVSGDTLFGISRTYGVSVEEIRRLNSLSGNNISVGQNLRIRA